MDKDTLFALKALAWAPATGLCWLSAWHGYTSTPRFDMWFWGLSFGLNVVALAVSVTALALRR